MDRKLNMTLVLIAQTYFQVPKEVRLNATHFFIMKFPKKPKLQQIATIIHLIFTLMNLRGSTKSMLKDHIHFWLLIPQFYQKMPCIVQEPIGRRIDISHDN